MELKTTVITIKKVSELIAYDNNPRDNDGAVDAVANSKSNYYVLKKEFPNIKCIGMDYPVNIGAIL